MFTLAPILSRHPFSAAFAERIVDGAEVPLTDISNADHLADVTATLARGNHKLARGHKAKLLEMLKDKVNWEWQLLLPKEAALKLPHCKVSPLRIVLQTTIGTDGAKGDKTQAHSRPVVQRIPRDETKRQRPSGRGKAEARAFRTSAATFSPLHVSTAATISKQAADDDEGGLQVSVPEDSPPSILGWLANKRAFKGLLSSAQKACMGWRVTKAGIAARLQAGQRKGVGDNDW